MEYVDKAKNVSIDKTCIVSNDTKIGEGSKIDPFVILGFSTGRKIKKTNLEIGNNSHIRSHSVIYQGSKIGENFETGHNVVIREEVEIGNNCKIWSNVYIDYQTKIGNDVHIMEGAEIFERSRIGDNIFIGPNSILINSFHPECKYEKKCMKGPIIKKNVNIGGNCVILPRVVINENSLIGAGSVVTKDVPKNSVVIGNPAKICGSIFDLKCKTKLNPMGKPYKKSNLG